MDEESAKPCIQDRLRDIARNRREWLAEKYPWITIIISFLIAGCFLWVNELAQFRSSFFPGFVATILGVLVGASITLLEIKGRQKRAHNKFLRDIFIELNKNSNHLDSHGHILNTDIWDSGISSGSILVIDSKELGELSNIYHKIETNIYEAKICRQASANYNSLPVGSSKDQAKVYWDALSKALHKREPDLKKQIYDFLKKDFWEKAGVDKAHK